MEPCAHASIRTTRNLLLNSRLTAWNLHFLEGARKAHIHALNRRKAGRAHPQGYNNIGGASCATRADLFQKTPHRATLARRNQSHAGQAMLWNTLERRGRGRAARRGKASSSTTRPRAARIPKSRPRLAHLGYAYLPLGRVRESPRDAYGLGSSSLSTMRHERIETASIRAEFCLMALGRRFAEGFREYEIRPAPRIPRPHVAALPPKAPLWRRARLGKGKRVLVAGEQGAWRMKFMFRAKPPWADIRAAPSATKDKPFRNSAP